MTLSQKRSSCVRPSIDRSNNLPKVLVDALLLEECNNFMNDLEDESRITRLKESSGNLWIDECS